MANLDMEPLNIMVSGFRIGIRLKEADSEASRCRDINFYRKKHRCFKSLVTLTYALIFIHRPPKWVQDPGNGLKSIRGSLGGHLGSISGVLDPLRGL